MKQITIHSDGTPGGTVIVDEDGNRLEGVTNAAIEMEVDSGVRVTLEIAMPKTAVTGNVKEINFVCPLCGDAMEHKCEPDLGSAYRGPLPGGIITSPPLPQIRFQ